MKKIILFAIFFIVNPSVCVYATATTPSHATSDSKTVKADDAVHYGQILSEWTALKAYDATHPIDLSPFEMLKKESWAKYTLEKFKVIPEFRQEKSLASLKKIVLQMVLTRNVPLSVITNFLTAEEAGPMWRAILDDMIHHSGFLQSHATDMGQVIHTLMKIPLSVVDRKELVLPIPDAYQADFSEFYDHQSASGGAPKCLQENTPPAPKTADHPSVPKPGVNDPKHFSINGDDINCYTHWVSALTQAYLTALADVDALKNLTEHANLDALNQRILREIDAVMHQNDHSNDDNASDGSSRNDGSSSSPNNGGSGGSTSSADSVQTASNATEYHFDSEYIGKTFEAEKEEAPVSTPHKTKNFLDQLKGKKVES